MRHWTASWAACGLVLLTLGCSERDSGGLVVRQVVTGAGQAPSAAEAQAPAAAVGVATGSTLVADTPRALYRRAYERSRRRADGLSTRERLSTVEDALREAALEFR